MVYSITKKGMIVLFMGTIYMVLEQSSYADKHVNQNYVLEELVAKFQEKRSVKNMK